MKRDPFSPAGRPSLIQGISHLYFPRSIIGPIDDKTNLINKWNLGMSSHPTYPSAIENLISAPNSSSPFVLNFSIIGEQTVRTEYAKSRLRCHQRYTESTTPFEWKKEKNRRNEKKNVETKLS